MAVCRANAQPAAWLAKSSPAKTLVTACSRLRVTSRLNVTPTCAAMARTASWIGLPSTTPQVARRIADARGGVQVEDGLDRGQARRDHLRTAREAGEEVRLDEARGDAHVAGRGRRIRRARAWRVLEHGADLAVAVGVEGVVLDDAAQLADVGAEHLRRARRSVHARWVPVAMKMRDLAGAPLCSSSTSTGRTRRPGNGRVTSHTEMPTDAPRGITVAQWRAGERLFAARRAIAAASSVRPAR